MALVGTLFSTELNGQKTAISETSLSGMYMLRMVEHAAVNRRVVGSSPTIGAKQLVLIAARVHPFPYRTRKLSSLALKILGGKLPGKISRCQHLNL